VSESEKVGGGKTNARVRGGYRERGYECESERVRATNDDFPNKRREGRGRE
jgi:hypothetical protein